MKLNSLKFAIMNNSLRAALQRQFETPPARNAEREARVRDWLWARRGSLNFALARRGACHGFRSRSQD